MSGPSPADMLRALGSLTRPGAASPERAAPNAEAFGRLLDAAKSGVLETGMPVTVADGAGVELDAAQLEALAGVVDRAHAAGATRIAVLVDGKALDVDVLSRRVLGELDLGGGRVLTGVDGVVRLGGDTGMPLQLSPPPPGTVDPSVLRLLSDGERGAA